MSRLIPDFPNYSIDIKGNVTYKGQRVLPRYKSDRNPFITLLNPTTGQKISKSIPKLIRNVFSDAFAPDLSDAIIYHVEGTLPDITKELTKIQKELQEYFIYDCISGKLSYRNLIGSEVPSWCSKQTKYREIQYKKATHQHHVIVVLYMLGELPDKAEIDHVNHNRSDNRWINLRVVNRKVNARNLSMHSTNKSGVTGVSWLEKTQNWRAYIMVNYKQINLGYYKDKEAAIKARKQAEIDYEFHPNHGK